MLCIFRRQTQTPRPARPLGSLSGVVRRGMLAHILLGEFCMLSKSGMPCYQSLKICIHWVNFVFSNFVIQNLGSIYKFQFNIIF